jgi:hypothetical protein
VSEQTSTPKLTGQFSKALVYAELGRVVDELKQLVESGDTTAVV